MVGQPGKRSHAGSIGNVRDYIDLPFVHNTWYVAGLCEEFGRTPKARTLLQKSVVFFRTEAGDLTALQNRCLHRSFPLAEGYLEGDLLVCGYHGMRYDADGAIVRIPCQSQLPDRKLRKFPVRELGPFVWIWMGDADHPEMEERFPDLSFLADPAFRTVHDATPIKCSYLLMLENLNDLTHFAYLHRETFGIDDYFLELEAEAKRTPQGVSCRHVDTDPVRSMAGLPGPLQERLRGKQAERWDHSLMPAPGICIGHNPILAGEIGAQEREALEQFRITARPSDDQGIFDRYIMHFLTPETKSTTHYFWSISSNFGLDDDAYNAGLKALAGKGFDEDKWACEHMQTLLENDAIEFDELTIAGDRGGMLFRRAMRDWVNQEYEAAAAQRESVDA